MKIKLSPSLICMDLCNIEKSVNDLSSLDIDALHIDIIDGYFSPSMPMGLDVVRALRKKTDLPFDVHIMANKNDFFISEMINIGAQQICFQYETEIHVDRVIDKIKKSGIRAGVALVPSTPVSVLEYVIDKCDFVLLMLINPGYAGDQNEEQVPYALRKVNDCYNFIHSRGLGVSIEIDGRVTTKCISEFIVAGADIIVLGSKSLFYKKYTVAENYSKIKSAVAHGVERRVTG